MRITVLTPRQRQWLAAARAARAAGNYAEAAMFEALAVPREHNHIKNAPSRTREDGDR